MGWWGPTGWVNVDLRCWVATFERARIMAQNSIQSHWDSVWGMLLETAVGGNGGGWWDIGNEAMAVSGLGLQLMVPGEGGLGAKKVEKQAFWCLVLGLLCAGWRSKLPVG